METDPKYFRIGLFTVSLASLLAVALILFSKLDFFNKEHLYTIYFSGSVNGLRENEDVKFHGVSVGKVKKISVSKSQIDKIKVIVNIHAPQLIRKNVVARIEAQGLTGFTYVQLYGGDKTQPLLVSNVDGKNPIIPSAPSNIESLITEAPKIFDNINGLLKQLKVFFDDQTVGNLSDTIKNFKMISANLVPESQKVPLIMADAHRTLQSISKISEFIEAFIKTSQPAVQNFTSTGLPKLNQLVQDLQATAHTLNRLVTTVEADPVALLQKTTEPGYIVP